jgi:CelD/BcsL family acetyltransferase involved in cellulose biosynthesis
MLSNKKNLIIKTPEELEEYIPAWEKLVKNATDENIFFEPSILIPALRHLNNEQAFILLIVSKEQDLIGLFPLVSSKKYKGLPIPHLSIWQTQQCFLGTPLVHKDYIETCLNSLFQWLEQTQQYFLSFREFLDDSLFSKELEHFLKTKKYGIDEVEQHKRAFLQSDLTIEQYLKQNLSRNTRKRLRNKANGLSKQGVVKVSILDKNNIIEENLEQWIKDFLQLEKNGWKGNKTKTALACDDNEKKYFIDISKNAAKQSKLLMFKLSLDDKPIAMQSNFISHNGVFAFKVAYDESYSKYSPGILLDLENFKYILNSKQWMDSCAMPNSTSVSLLWKQQRGIRSFNVSTQSWKSKFVVSLLSFFRKIYRL